MKTSVKFCLISIILLLFLWGNAETSEELPGEDATGNAVTSMRDKVLSFFQPVIGEVGRFKGDTVNVIVGDEIILEEGVRLSVFREGDPFYHPTTKELIGRTEDFVGVIEIRGKDNKDDGYICTVVRGEVKSGDIARITASKVKLAFFQDRGSDWSISEAFFSSLKDTGRFNILEKYSPGTDRDKLIELSKGLGAEVLLFLSTPVVDNKKLLNVELFWVEDSKLFSNISNEISSEYIHELTRHEGFISKSLTDKEPWSSYELDGGELFTIGDINGNGEKELIVSDGADITVYNISKEMQKIWSISGNPRERHLSVDSLDLNGNGKDEIFVTSITNEDRTSSSIRDDGASSVRDRGRISSFVIEYTPSEGYRKIAVNLPFFMRVSAGKLLMQRFSKTDIFSSPVFTGKWREGHYETDEEVLLPEGVNIYGFTYVDWQNKGDLHIMTLDDNGFLKLYKKNALVWQSEKTYGKPLLSFKKVTPSIINPEDEWFIRGRLIAVNTEEGQKVIAVKRNPLLSKVPRLGSFSAEVYTLWWNGSSMEEELMLGEVSGSVSDYWVDGKRLYLFARAGLFSFAKNVVKGTLSRPSILYYYNFEKK